jgi:hypothetical protein
MSIDQRQDGVWELTVTGPVGAKYKSEYTTNFSVWVPIATNVNSSGSITITDPAAQSSPRRFYRAVLVP